MLRVTSSHRRKKKATSDNGAVHDVMAFENPIYDQERQKQNPAQKEDDYDEPANMTVTGHTNGSFAHKPEDEEDMYVS